VATPAPKRYAIITRREETRLFSGASFHLAFVLSAIG
jgi:hypothetical protein